ncbi:MAG: MFS transporter [Candidatus Helarchaeota archaeon]|nr:MFS transporter [Candidatus Helarchaeota archaeon]
MELKDGEKKLSRFLIFQIIIIGILYAAAQIFGYLEAQIFNTFLDHVLRLEYIYISIMVAFSALAGLLSHLFLGILSDNSRSRFGRRRPFLVFGGLLAGISMIIYPFSQDYLTAVIIDVIAVGIASNSYYVAQRALIPDLVDIEYRGRANGIVNILGNIGLVVGVASTLILNEIFGIPDLLRWPGTIITREGYIFILLIGGIVFFIVSLVGFLFIKEKSGSELPPKKPFFQEFKEIFKIEEFKKNREFYKFVFAFTIFNSGVYTILPFLFIYIFDLGFSTTTMVIILGISAPFTFLMMYLLGKYADKYGRKKFITPTIIISCFGFFIIPFLDTTVEPILVLYVFAFASILTVLLGVLTPLNAWHQDLLPEEKRGKFLGILNITNTVSQVIGALIGGIIATIFGLTVIFAFAPIFFIISLPLFMRIKETLPGLEN